MPLKKKTQDFKALIFIYKLLIVLLYGENSKVKGLPKNLSYQLFEFNIFLD